MYGQAYGSHACTFESAKLHTTHAAKHAFNISQCTTHILYASHPADTTPMHADASHYTALAPRHAYTARSPNTAPPPYAHRACTTAPHHCTTPRTQRTYTTTGIHHTPRIHHTCTTVHATPRHISPHATPTTQPPPTQTPTTHMPTTPHQLDHTAPENHRAHGDCRSRTRIRRRADQAHSP